MHDKITKIKTGNKFFDRVVQLKYFGTTLTNQNLINEEIKISLE